MEFRGAQSKLPLVEQLAGTVPSVLLLSGTPEQLGEDGHFARLRLLDPVRFHSLQQFQREQERYAMVASVVEKLFNGVRLGDEDQDILSAIYHYDSHRLKNHLRAIQAGSDRARQGVITELVDCHGTSRLFYRNQRDNIAGFPKRLVDCIGLGLSRHCMGLFGALEHSAAVVSPEFKVPPEQWEEWWKHDPRVKAVIKLLERSPHEKMLLICARQETARALQEAIESTTGIRLAVFHEGLSLMVRDRQAAYFADPDGARLLICSEIGSEGRNFQFSHHLILFDLPKNPELLEQRIGRLDRIGQKKDIHIHVLYLERTPQEVFARWYNEGLNAFSQPLRGASNLYEELGDRVGELASNWYMEQNYDKIHALIVDTQEAKKRLARKLATGRDRLLEWNSHRPEIGNALVETIDISESQSGLAAFVEALCQYLGVHVEDHDHNCLFLLPGDLYRGLPGLPEQGSAVTFSRQRALAREDIPFLSWEHPMVVGGMDQLLGSSDGKASYGFWEDPNSRSILLEAVFLVSCTAPRGLFPERFLPPTPLRILVNHAGKNLSDEIRCEQLRNRVRDDAQRTMLQKPEVTRQIVPHMIQHCRNIAQVKKQRIIESALESMRSTLDPEIERLTLLIAAKAPVHPDEIQHLRKERMQLETYFIGAIVRLDAVRVVWRGPSINVGDG